MALLHGPERLRVYHLALLFAREVDLLISMLSCHGSLAEQLRRAAESIVLNIAEGAAHFSPRRKVYHYQIAHASAGECISGLAHLRSRYPQGNTTTLRRHADMICVMLSALIRALENGRADP